MLKKFMQLLLQSYGQRSQRIAGRAPALEEQKVGEVSRNVIDVWMDLRPMKVSDVQEKGCVARVISQDLDERSAERYRRGHSSTLSLEAKLAPIGRLEPP
jgi:hypothetical protein